VHAARAPPSSKRRRLASLGRCPCEPRSPALARVAGRGGVRLSPPCNRQAAQDKPPKEIGRCQAGDYFGEIALLTNRSRACTVTAVGPVKVLTLQRKTFNRVMGPLRDLLKRNMEAYNSYMLM
jgi:hypothetical protein